MDAQLVVPLRHSPRFLCLSADGGVMASADAHVVKIWHSSPIRELRSIHFQSTVSSIQLTRDGKLLSVTQDDLTFRVFDVRAGIETAWSKENHWMGTFHLSADGRRVVNATGDGSVRIWNGR
jgi:WD40 repeat protein